MKQLLALLLLFPATNHAQQRFSFQPRWNQTVLKAGSYYPAAHTTDSFRIDVLRFYISVLQPNNSNEDPEHVLIDLSEPGSQEYTSNCNGKNLLLGVDSLTQMSGAGGGALDPIHGMYWTWQSGYIHLKLEGTVRSADGRFKPFSYHIGGFETPYNTLQTLNNDSSSLNPDLAVFFAHTDPWTQGDVMSPGLKAVTIAQAWKACFVSKR